VLIDIIEMPINLIRLNNKLYKFESYWRPSRTSKIEDSEGVRLPYPKKYKGSPWQTKDIFIKKLQDTEKKLKTEKKYTEYEKSEYKDCLLCDKKNVTKGFFQINKFRWEDGLIHYITVHDIKPSDEFIDFIFRYQLDRHIVGIKRSTKIKGITIVKNSKRYLKIDRNQIMIMDALMMHGSSKLYVDPKNKNIYRYSEHAGLLDFNEDDLEKTIISGKTNRVDAGDEDIYLPNNMLDAFDYEYIFHTHPSTPRPGSRAVLGVLYEFPSIADIFHFIDHYNDGKTQGSIVITPEGMYIIRKKDLDNMKIRIDENKFYRNAIRIFKKVQDEAIDNYGTSFSNQKFYSTIAQNKKYINEVNDVLNNYEIHIDYYSRVKDTKGHWIIDSVYVPVYPIEAKK
jgi:hypothetical protein